MNGSLYLFENIGRVPDRFILEADRALGLSGKTRRGYGKKKLWKAVLLAAVLAALLGVMAYAAGLFNLKAHIFPVEGTQKVVVVPNGLQGTKTYEGTGEWWVWVFEHKNDAGDSTLSFIQGDDRKFKTCQLYNARTPEAADKLYEIAEAYGLSLYSECITAPNRERIYELSGMRPFLTEGDEELRSGYVFPDGSFKAEGDLALGELKLSVTLHRFSTGALYPYGGVSALPEYSEREYVSGLGQTVNIVRWQGGQTELWYLNGDGKTFVELDLYDLPGGDRLKEAGIEDPDALAEYVADRVDFAAICENNHAVEEIVSTPRGAEDNRDAAQRLADFYNSDAFRAAREFQDFFTANFYGACFTGVHGQAGYEDIDAELERLGEQYHLRYAESKTVDGDATFYDNGAFYQEPDIPMEGVDLRCRIHYIPKNALYTRMIHYVDFAEYRRVWTYETAAGQEIVCAMDGPDKISSPCLFYETENAYVLASFGYNDVSVIEWAAEQIDWARFD